jgi:uncharacterized protein
MIFLDTSAIYALADKADNNHKEAVFLFGKLIDLDEKLFVHNYIIVEAAALIQARLGVASALKFLEEAGYFHTVWVNEHAHKKARIYFKEQAKRKLSFVDCMSFTVMKKEGTTQAFAFDQDFVKAGFTLYH